MVCTILTTLGVLVALRLVVGLVRWKRRGRGHGCRRGWGGFGQSRWLRRAFARLDTTPGQEREIKAALDELRETARAQKARRGELGGKLADALEAETFDDGALLGTARDAVDSVQEAASRALKRIASVLDDKQRKMLAAWLRSRGGFGPMGGGPMSDGGPYRTAITI